jgi:hypothetical protein
MIDTIKNTDREIDLLDLILNQLYSEKKLLNTMKYDMEKIHKQQESERNKWKEIFS